MLLPIASWTLPPLGIPSLFVPDACLFASFFAACPATAAVALSQESVLSLRPVTSTSAPALPPTLNPPTAWLIGGCKCRMLHVPHTSRVACSTCPTSTTAATGSLPLSRAATKRSYGHRKLKRTVSGGQRKEAVHQRTDARGQESAWMALPSHNAQHLRYRGQKTPRTALDQPKAALQGQNARRCTRGVPMACPRDHARRGFDGGQKIHSLSTGIPPGSTAADANWQVTAGGYPPTAGASPRACITDELSLCRVAVGYRTSVDHWPPSVELPTAVGYPASRRPSPRAVLDGEKKRSISLLRDSRGV